MKLALSVIPEKELSAGSGTYTMIRDMGNPTGQTTALAVFGTLSASSVVGALRERSEKLGVNPELMPAIEEARKSEGAIMDPNLIDKLSELGVKFQDLLGAAQLDGMVKALNSMSYFVIAFGVLVFCMCFLLPKSSDISEKKTKNKMIISNEETQIQKE